MGDPPAVEWQWLAGNAELGGVMAVRFEVFVGEQQVPAEEEWDAWDASAEHLLGSVDGRAVATGRLLINDGQWQIGRVAVREPFRRGGVGRELMRRLLDRARERGADEVHLHAQTRVVGFYERLGFSQYGDLYDEAGIEHVNMVLRWS